MTVEPTTEGVAAPVIQDPAAVLAALERAKSDAKKNREQYEALKKEVDEGGWQQRAKRAELKLALAEEKVANPDRVVRLIDLNDLDYDKDGNLIGVAEKVETLKSDFPELFDVKRRSKHEDRQPGQPANAGPRSTTDMQVDAILGSG